MIDKAREHREREMARGFEACGIPDYMQEGLLNYVLDGEPTGGFLTAVLSNDLMEATGRADNVNQQMLRNYCKFLYNHVPSQCKGSPERVKEWIAAHKKRREEEAVAP